MAGSMFPEPSRTIRVRSLLARKILTWLSGAADSRNTDLLALTAGESDASGIGIALYDQNKTLIPLGQESDVVTLSPGQASAHLQFYARYLADGGAVTPGDANASATFILAYE